MFSLFVLCVLIRFPELIIREALHKLRDLIRMLLSNPERESQSGVDASLCPRTP